MSVCQRTAFLTLLFAAATSACGCESTRSFFQMTSDSPTPFFGLDMTLPPKFGRGQDAPLPDATDGATFGDLASPAR